jgi:hypothetical protein
VQFLNKYSAFAIRHFNYHTILEISGSNAHYTPFTNSRCSSSPNNPILPRIDVKVEKKGKIQALPGFEFLPSRRNCGSLPASYANKSLGYDF